MASNNSKIIKFENVINLEFDNLSKYVNCKDNYKTYKYKYKFDLHCLHKYTDVVTKIESNIPETMLLVQPSMFQSHEYTLNKINDLYMYRTFRNEPDLVFYFDDVIERDVKIEIRLTSYILSNSIRKELMDSSFKRPIKTTNFFYFDGLMVPNDLSLIPLRQNLVQKESVH
jgi:hypothetical protein